MRNKEARAWDRYIVDDIKGTTLGIVGYGDIGRATARCVCMYVCILDDINGTFGIVGYSHIGRAMAFCGCVCVCIYAWIYTVNRIDLHAHTLKNIIHTYIHTYIHTLRTD
jgi:lactate dehydrogenase-like 2-hydroxyacid dehydrogenase